MNIEEALGYISRAEEDIQNNRDPTAYFNQVIESIQSLIDNGMIWRMFQPGRNPYYYQTIAHGLILAGVCKNTINLYNQ